MGKTKPFLGGQVNAYLPREVFDAIVHQAAKEMVETGHPVPLAKIVRRAVMEYCERHSLK